jgi:hydrogenase nickel incorporation protein HypA/HybF
VQLGGGCFVHDFGLMTQLLDAIETKAHEMGSRPILSINLLIGDRASIVDDSLLFYFDMLTPGTLAEGADLNVRRVPSRFYCHVCGAKFTPSGYDFRCPTCNEVGTVTTEGSELQIESIVLAKD